MARRKPPQRRAVQLGAVVQAAAADMLAYTLRSHGIVLELALAEPLPDVQADPDQLGQLVLNLSVNAQQAFLAAADEADPAEPPHIVISSGLEVPRPGRQARVWLRVADMDGPASEGGVRKAGKWHLFMGIEGPCGRPAFAK